MIICINEYDLSLIHETVYDPKYGSTVYGVSSQVIKRYLANY